MRIGDSWFFVGVDLGQAQDFTAVAAVERAELVGEWDPVVAGYPKYVELRTRFLERMELGTPYPEVAQRVRNITCSADLRGRCHLAVDSTGVGRPVVDLLRRAGLDCIMMPVTITGGSASGMTDGQYYVPKRDLITGVQTLLQSGGLRIARSLKHGAALAAEMAEMRVKITAAGNTQFGAWREGAHDDLVLALALACWSARQVYPHGPYGEDAYWRSKEHAKWERGLREWRR
jgi:hypothetical protein